MSLRRETVAVHGGRPSEGPLSPAVVLASNYRTYGYAREEGSPTWEALDGSIVAAARDGGATVDPTAVDWLRLKATSATAGPDGDRLGATTYIQRIHTAGGLAPAAADCDAGNVAEQREIPYSADYVFFKATNS